MISESLLIKLAVYFAGIFISIGLAVHKELIIEIGLAPLILLAILWFFQYTGKMKEGLKHEKRS